VVNSHLAFQYECIHEAFGDLLDEERMVENFYRTDLNLEGSVNREGGVICTI